MKKGELQGNLSELKINLKIAQAGRWKVNLFVNMSIFLIVIISFTFQQTFAAESRMVKVGSDNHFPLIFQDRNGVAQGLYVDILTEIGRQENIRFEYVFGTWADSLNLIKSGIIDLLPGIAYTNERSQFMNYSKNPILTVWGELYALKTSEIKSILDVSGKRIGVIKTDINAKNFLELTKQFHVNCELVELAGYEDVFKAIKSKTVDAGVVGVSYGAAKQSEYELRSTGVVFNPYDLYISTTKGKNQDLILIIDKYLNEWRNQDISVLSNAKQKWIYGSVGTVAVAPDWMINVFILLGIVVVVALAFIMLLKLQVKRATKTLRESEELFRVAMESAPDGVYMNDLEGNFLYGNRKAEELLGYRREELLDRNFLVLNIIAEDSLSKAAELLKENIECRSTGPDELELVRKDGRHILIEITTNVIQRGGQTAVLAFVRDITERKQAEEDKAKLECRLQQAQKMESIGSLAGGIAHDLNNILFPISGLSEMLLDDMPADTPVHKSVEQIHKSAKRGSDLVKQILAFSRQSNPQKLPIRIQPILTEVLKLVQATVPRNIEVNSHISTDCGMVSADPTQIHQISMNLITNAYHAVEEKGGTIHIDLKEVESGKHELHDISIQSGKYACITVSDTGTGIDKNLMDKIFDPYFTTKEMGKGTGLGLSVVHGIVKEHGGDIRVYSEVGQGTVFHVYLPLLDDSRNSKTATVTRKYPTGSESILLVDDEAPIIRLEQMMLERLGYQITTRMSSPDALDAFRANPSKFDLVISDRDMPNMTGEQLARELISIRPEIPIILCTGFSDENDERRARDLGVKGFLKKPVATGDLAKMVRKVLDEVTEGKRVHDSGQADAIAL